jgi:hypothetical protein
VNADLYNQKATLGQHPDTCTAIKVKACCSTCAYAMMYIHNSMQLAPCHSRDYTTAPALGPLHDVDRHVPRHNTYSDCMFSLDRIHVQNNMTNISALSVPAKELLSC